MALLPSNLSEANNTMATETPIAMRQSIKTRAHLRFSSSKVLIFI